MCEEKKSWKSLWLVRTEKKMSTIGDVNKRTNRNMGNASSRALAGAKPIAQLDALRDLRDEYYASIEAALESGEIGNERAYALLAERARQRPDEADQVLSACRDPQRMATLPRICALLNERADDISSLVSSLSRNGAAQSTAPSYATAVSDNGSIALERASESDVKRYAKYKARDKLKFTEALERDMTSGALSAGQALDLAERYVAKYPSTDKWMWAVCDSQDEEDFPLFCRVVDAHRRRCGERADFARTLLSSLGERERAAESTVKSLEQSVREARETAEAEQKRLRESIKQQEAQLLESVKEQEARLRDAREQEKALESEQALAQARLEMAEDDCSKRVERTVEDQRAAEKRAKRAQVECDKRAKNVEKMRRKVDEQRRALEKALEALREAEIVDGDDCNEAMKQRARAAELEERAEQLRAEERASIADESAPEEDEDEQVLRVAAADILQAAETQELRDRALNAKLVLPAHNPYSTFGTEDDPDDFVAPGGVFLSAGAGASKHAYDIYAAKPYSRSLISRPTSEQYLALYHDLLSQSPWSDQFEGSEERKFNLMRELERKYMGVSGKMSAKQLADLVADQVYGAYDDAPTAMKNAKKSSDCRALPFDFTPFGTTQVYRNWPANRPIRTKDGKCKPVLPDEAWLRSKISTENMPFDVRWYDADLYFAHASLPRLLRMQLGKYVKRIESANDAESKQQLATFRNKILQSIPCKKDASDWQQCAVDFMLLALRPSPEEPENGESALRERRSEQRLLFAEGDYLGAIRNKKRTIAYYAVLMLWNSAVLEDSDFNVDVFVTAVRMFTQSMSAIYQIVSAVPDTQAVTLAQQRDRDAFINEIGKFVMNKSKAFEARALTDVIENDEELDKEEFVMVEALRWTLYFLSDEGDNECALNVPFACLSAALRKVFSRDRKWYVLDAHVLRNFAIVNYNALMACSLGNLETDETLLSESFSGDLLDKQIKERTEFACSRRRKNAKQTTRKTPKAPRKQVPIGQYEDLTMSEHKALAQKGTLPTQPPAMIQYSQLPPAPLDEEKSIASVAAAEDERAIDEQKRALERFTGGAALSTGQRQHLSALMQKGKLDPCKRDLCAAGIVDKKSYRKWLLRAHPDKGGDTETFQRMMDCLNADAEDESDRTYCPAFGGPEQSVASEDTESAAEQQESIEASDEASDDKDAYALGSMLAATRSKRAAATPEPLRLPPPPPPALLGSEQERSMRSARDSQDERPKLRSIEEQQGLSPEKVMAWRRMRLLENLKVLRGERGEEGSKSALDSSSAVNLQERKDLNELSRKYPDLQRLLKYSDMYAELRRLQRDAYDNESAERAYEAERERVFKIDQAQQVGAMLLALLDAEEKWLDESALTRCSSISGTNASEKSCRASGCRLSAGTYSETYNRCYDPELQAERSLGIASTIEDRSASF